MKNHFAIRLSAKSIRNVFLFFLAAALLLDLCFAGRGAERQEKEECSSSEYLHGRKQLAR